MGRRSETRNHEQQWIHTEHQRHPRHPEEELENSVGNEAEANSGDGCAPRRVGGPEPVAQHLLRRTDLLQTDQPAPLHLGAGLEDWHVLAAVEGCLIGHQIHGGPDRGRQK